MNVWRAGPAPKGNGEVKAGNIDRAAVARQHDEEEAAPPPVAAQPPQEPDPATLPATLATCRRIHAEAEEAVRTYLAALEATDPQLKALIAVREAAAVAVEAMGKHA